MPEHKLRLPCMFAAYLDASGKTEDVRNPGCPAIAMAGYVAPVEAWLRFGDKWRKMLTNFKLTLAHHNDFAQSKNEYAAWEEKDRREYIRRGSHIINQTVHRGVAAAVLLKDYARLTSESPGELSSFSFVAINCLKQIVIWARESSRRRPIAYCFEAGDGHDAEILQVRREIMADPVLTETYRFKSMTLVDKRDPEFVQLQAADWLAWEAAKYLKDTKLKTAKPRRMRYSLTALLKPGKVGTLYYDGARLLRLGEANRRGEGRL